MGGTEGNRDDEVASPNKKRDRHAESVAQTKAETETEKLRAKMVELPYSCGTAALFHRQRQRLQTYLIFVW